MDIYNNEKKGKKERKMIGTSALFLEKIELDDETWICGQVGLASSLSTGGLPVASSKAGLCFRGGASLKPPLCSSCNFHFGQMRWFIICVNLTEPWMPRYLFKHYFRV